MTLQRKTPLSRTGWRRKPRNAMRTASPELAARRRAYSARVRVWIRLPENRWCPVAASGVMHPLGLPQRIRTTDCHHKWGREGKKLLDETYWLAVSRAGHNWIRDHGNEARKRGWLI